jgi:hypothetical protein
VEVVSAGRWLIVVVRERQVVVVVVVVVVFDKDGGEGDVLEERV